MVTIQKAAKRGQWKTILAALKNLHNNFEDTYKSVLQRINQEDPDSGFLVYQILSWILLAYCPLTMKELQGALQVMEGITNIDPQDYMIESHIIFICQGLVIVSKEYHTVTLIRMLKTLDSL